MAGFNITIDKKTWQVKIEADGYTGGECITDIDALMESMGAKTVEQWEKPELHEGEVGIVNMQRNKA